MIIRTRITTIYSSAIQHNHTYHLNILFYGEIKTNKSIILIIYHRFIDLNVIINTNIPVHDHLMYTLPLAYIIGFNIKF